MAVDFSLTAGQETLRREARRFFAEHLTAEVRSELAERGDEHVPSFHRLLGEQGWIGLQWPREYGGRGAGFVEGAIYQEEAARAGAPVLASSIAAIIGNTLIRLGSDELKARFLPATVRGELVFCLGYTEPEAGSDLASLRTRATRRDGSWVINGSKMFTSLAHVADYMFCAVRTDPDASRHRGISVFLVPMDQVEVHPVLTLGGFRTNATFLDDVVVGDDNLVGEVDRGWDVLAVALDYERSGTQRVGQCKRMLALLARAVGGDDTLLDDVVVREALGQLEAEVRSAEVLAYSVAWMQAQGLVPNTEASMSKIVATELVQRITGTALDLLGSRAALARDALGAIAEGELEEEFRNTIRFTVTGGTSEIQRNIVSQRGLRLPRGA
ncbi:MAG: acyl-CoA dehydrogenase family protein [Acidimicrobiia bacterium]|nr:acyl-CoA dehydrogenase family protein [Acidimicrobiia bacterium]